MEKIVGGTVTFPTKEKVDEAKATDARRAKERAMATIQQV